MTPHDNTTYLVTGAAGFIGSNLVEALLRQGERVRGLDNFATGHRHNLEDVRRVVGEEAFARFEFIEGDIRELETCRRACEGVEVVLHQAALGSVPRSIKDPLATHAVNVDGFVHMLVAARDAGVRRFVYASSSSVYGDHPGLPKVEDQIGTPLSPYAVTKRINELYARTFQDHYGLETIGLRYFNVFGPRQDPEGPYAAVIPKWVAALLAGEACTIHGDGETTRDFCYVANAVQANLRAAEAPAEATGHVYNIACGDRTTLNELHASIREALRSHLPEQTFHDPAYGPFREGDVRHSLADVSLAGERVGYAPAHSAHQGLAEAIAWYVSSVGSQDRQLGLETVESIRSEGGESAAKT
jgi:UDP-N-acetylglucosamine/UDP-N-acetylgalactosamine 4-epimerase